MPRCLFSAESLRSATSLQIAGWVLLGFAVAANILVTIYFYWLVFFRRFGNRLSFWLGIQGVYGYLSLFLFADAEPEIRGLFYWAHVVEKTGVDWVLLLGVSSMAIGGCLFFVVGCLEWWFLGGVLDRSDAIVGLYPRRFDAERISMAVLLLLGLPGFFILLRSLWAPLSFGDDVLSRYLFLTQQTLDALTFGLFSSYALSIVCGSDAGSPTSLSSTELWSYSILVGAIVLPLIFDLAQQGRGRRGKETTK